MKRIISVAAAFVMLLALALFAPTVDASHDHKSNAPAAASAHYITNYCGHGTNTTFGWWEVFNGHATRVVRGALYHDHIHYEKHVSRFWSPTHLHSKICGRVDKKTGKVYHW